ncbi:MAG: glycosyl transferase [Gammaproteobacteria bacterium]|nr:MAG: glycosyl transferase [Gammaproteobacteria bacterium]PIE36515.1 MAG: glycosyl transferase [Gammaproteobacteria bacterium]
MAPGVIWFQNLFYSKVAGRLLPASWFGPPPPPVNELEPSGLPLKLEIVAHCWQYSHLWTYQLSSLLNHTPGKVSLTYTLYHAAEDAGTRALIDALEARESQRASGINWQWRELPREQLMRRAIGRHDAATRTRAEWVWFTDCDLIFHDNCLDSLAEALAGRRARLVFPAGEFITAELLPADHPWLHRGEPEHLPVDIDTSLFIPNPIAKAKGAFQIVHGDVCRRSGYCGNIRPYQTPTAAWRKTFEDTAFRNLIGDQGEPVNVESLYRIRHEDKGRYTQASGVSALRRSIRRRTDNRSDATENA